MFTVLIYKESLNMLSVSGD